MPTNTKVPPAAEPAMIAVIGNETSDVEPLFPFVIGGGDAIVEVVIVVVEVNVGKGSTV